MGNHRRLMKALALAGTILVWLPLLAPVILAVGSLMRDGRFRLDYLMPAELFFVALAGGVLLIAASVLARLCRGLIIGGFVGAVAILGIAMLIAQVSGLASGAIEAQGIWWALTFSGLMLYIAGLVVTGVGGILLLRTVFRPGPSRLVPAP